MSNNKRNLVIKVVGSTILIMTGIMAMVNFRIFKCIASDTITAPKFSVNSGIYDNSFPLKITADNGCKVYYTLDGNTPDITSKLYTEELIIQDRSTEENVLAAHKAIKPKDRTDGGANSDYINTFAPTIEAVPKGTIVRAIAVDDNGKKSSVITNSYFVGLDTANRYHDLPIISLVTDQNNLFDYTRGIYCLGKVFDDFKATNNLEFRSDSWAWDANYSLRGREAEREGYIQMFESDGTLAFSQGVGIRIKGGATRSYLQKSFKLYARSEYDPEGQSSITYDIFKTLPHNSDGSADPDQFNNIILRNGGNDSDFTKLRDLFVQRLVSDRAFSTQATRPCIVFLDGEYWSVYNITENYDADYLKKHFGVNKSNVVMLENDEIDEGKDEDIELYNNVIEFAKNHDMSVEDNYNEICKMIDIKSFIDYYATENYIGNSDWPDNNVELWRVRETSDMPFEDGKWRWMLYDTEYSMGLYTQGAGANDDFIRITAQRDPLFPHLLKNDMFKEQFANTLFDLANVNFDYNRVDALLTELSGIYRPLMQDYYNRFTIGGRKFSLEGKFDINVDASRKFLKKRQEAIYKVAKSALSLKGSKVKVNLQSNVSVKDNLVLNTITPDMSTGDWSGYYYTDYPIALKAENIDGYTFEGWNICNGTEPDNKCNEVSVKLENDLEVIKAIYTKNN